MDTRADISRLTERLQEVARAEGTKLFLVGGVVRDILRGIALHDRDLDVVVEGNAIRFAEKAAGALGGELKRFPSFFTAKLVGPAAGGGIEEVDFASTRTERYRSPGALPEVEIATIAEDLRRRDFSVNAMAVPLEVYSRYLAGKASREEFQAAVIDEHHGREDLLAKRIRVLHPQSFIDDPTRLFRGCRYAARIGGDFEPETATLFSAAIADGALDSISRFRVATEIRKMVFEPSDAPVFEIADRCGLLRACGVVPAECHSEFTAVAARIQQDPRSNEEERLRALLLEIARLSEPGEAERRISAFGWSKKRIKALLQECGL